MRRPVAVGLCIFAVAVMFAHAVYLGDNLLLARLMPVADVIVWGNVQPLAAGLLAGLAWSIDPRVIRYRLPSNRNSPRSTSARPKSCGRS